MFGHLPFIREKNIISTKSNAVGGNILIIPFFTIVIYCKSASSSLQTTLINRLKVILLIM
ncbi:MAG: hypothetical protein ACJAUY_001561 [Cognaticolwellia sp.]|jgi:hypothetical protein